MQRRSPYGSGTVLCIILLLAACTSVHYQAEHLQDHVGTATQADILAFFGEPQDIRVLDNGDQVWVYRFVQTVMGGTAVAGRRVCWERVLTFDGQGILRAQERRDC